MRPDGPVEVLRVEGLVKRFPTRTADGRRSEVCAVDGVTFGAAAGTTLGVVGESGSGKSTLARLIVRLLDPTEGRVLFGGEDITTSGRRQLHHVRRQLQIVFQDPYASLNPRMTVADIVAQPLRVHRLYGRRDGPARVASLLELVGLGRDHGRRYPHELSGGQRQRVGIARALALEPRALVLDEPVSSLDVSIQAQVLNLLRDLQERLSLTYVFIAHDLAVVRHIADRVAVMHHGRIVEIGDSDDLYARPEHPYTQSLLAAVPVSDPSRRGERRRLVPEGEPRDQAGG